MYLCEFHFGTNCHMPQYTVRCFCTQSFALYTVICRCYTLSYASVLYLLHGTLLYASVHCSVKQYILIFFWTLSLATVHRCLPLFTVMCLSTLLFATVHCHLPLYNDLPQCKIHCHMPFASVHRLCTVHCHLPLYTAIHHG
jgi:hypothetical protein